MPQAVGSTSLSGLGGWGRDTFSCMLMTGTCLPHPQHTPFSPLFTSYCVPFLLAQHRIILYPSSSELKNTLI
ncbi:hypothetical protein XELAEV_18039429mg [Xenopus laevis]|uniref:Uncharacterized protein n=1 Tax=Xenopus laevis TaxID=8355 RepID=A0A974H7Y1_XENLA|nr:hypothetical protein XELAEV_18039429mg [Xenopus laevis]